MHDSTMQELLNQSAALHGHVCPRQVLGVRMGMYVAQLLELELPQRNKRLLTIVETDGCFADGVAVSTGCWLGRRTLRFVDFGKVAATFIDTRTGEAMRVHPSESCRTLASHYAPTARNRWHAYLEGYQVMPVHELLVAAPVRLVNPVEDLVSRPGCRAVCETCHEEILNEREIVRNDRVMCQACAGQAYYTTVAVPGGCQVGG
jgi:formylmethanofuran dehydrogenase subunit E